MKNKRLIFGALMLLTMTLSACSFGQNSENNTNDESSNPSEDVSSDSTIPEGHTHAWATSWSYDAQSHWHACSGCDNVNEKADHIWDAGTVKTPAEAYKPGLKEFKCTVCNKVKKETIPATGGNEPAGNFTFNDTELNTAQEIHTDNQKGYLEMNKEYYSMNGTDLNTYKATGASSLKKENDPKSILFLYSSYILLFKKMFFFFFF